MKSAIAQRAPETGRKRPDDGAQSSRKMLCDRLSEIGRETCSSAERASAEADQLLTSLKFNAAIEVLETATRRNVHTFDRALNSTLQNQLETAKLAEQASLRARLALLEGATYLSAGLFEDSARAYQSGLDVGNGEVADDLARGLAAADAGKTAQSLREQATRLLEGEDYDDALALLRQAAECESERESLRATELLAATEKLQREREALQMAAELATDLMDESEYDRAVDTLSESVLHRRRHDGTVVHANGTADDRLAKLMQRAQRQRWLVGYARDTLAQGHRMLAAGNTSGAVATYSAGIGCGAAYGKLTGQLELGLRTAEALHADATRWKHAIAKVRQCVEIKDYDEALALIAAEKAQGAKTAVSETETETETDTETETETESDEDGTDQEPALAGEQRTSSQLPSRMAGQDFVMGLRIDEFEASIRSAREAEASPAADIDAMQDASGVSEQVSRARQLVAAKAFGAAIPLLRQIVAPPGLADPQLHLELQELLFDALLAQNAMSISARREAIETRMAGVDPSSAEYEELAQALARLQAEEQTQARRANDADLSVFQRMPVAEQQGAFASLTVGVSVEWLQEFSQRTRQAMWQLQQERPSDEKGYLETTQAVWDLVVQPELGAAEPGSTTYVRWMFDSDPTARGLGVANLHVSHSALGSFVALVEGIVQYIERTRQDPAAVFVWIDGLSATATGHEATSDSIELAVSLGPSLVVLDPWNDPHVLRDTGALLSILKAQDVATTMSKEAYAEFKRALAQDGIEHCHGLMSRADCSAASHPNHARLIDAIDEMMPSHAEANAFIGSVLDEGLVELTKAVDMRGTIWDIADSGEPTVVSQKEVEQQQQDERLVNHPAQNLVSLRVL